MPNYKYNNGSNRERAIIKLALENGASVALKGGGSKSYSNNKLLKVDCIILKENIIYLIQSKKGSSSKKDKQDFITQTSKLKRQPYTLKALYIEDLAQAKEEFER